ncbi:MAG: peptidoglycan DD-metalloendopeptidase family protein [Methylococcaceae bacterium]|nr:peptidoglycan DD-metalloendopeptidase family protein [Methylococcaceae bacterium]
MKNKLYQSLFLGITSAIAASASYALITPRNVEIQASVSSLATPSIYEETANFLGHTAELEQPIRPRKIDHVIQSGENLSSIFPLYGLDNNTLDKITKANEIGARFADLAVDKILKIELDKEYNLESLVYKKDLVHTLIASKNGDAFDVRMDSKELEETETLAQGTITSSLSNDGQKAGLSPSIINKLADKIFAWDIDFNKDLQVDDKFTVIYEQSIVDGQRFDTGEVLAAEFIISGKSYSAVRYKDKEGNVEYYSPQGKNIRKIRKTFLRSPIEFARVSSHFNLRRKHPILNRIRAHRGVDYAARSGTPIQTVGDGKIVFRGRKGGYGNVVIVQHDDKKYKSLYAHMSKFNGKFKIGSKVKQGDVVGYVGKSGLATGPHLHYEFLVSGTHKNPLTVKLPRTEPKKNKAFIARFKAQTQPYLNRLNESSTDTAEIKAEALFDKQVKKL